MPATNFFFLLILAQSKPYLLRTETRVMHYSTDYCRIVPVSGRRRFRASEIRP